MSSIVKFLPPKAQEQVARDRARLEKSFNLQPGTIERAEQRASTSRTTSSARTPAPRTTPQAQPQEKPVPITPSTPSRDVSQEVARIQARRDAMTNARTDTRRTFDVTSGRELDITTITSTRDRFGRIRGGAGKIVSVRDVKTGEVTTTTFGTGRGGGSVRQTGGIIFSEPVRETKMDTGISSKELQSVFKSDDSLREIIPRDTGIKTIVPGERITSPAFTRRADLMKAGEFERESDIISQIQLTQPMARGLRTRAQFEQDTATIDFAQDLFKAQETQVIKPIELLGRQAQERIDLGGDYEQVSKQYEKEAKQVAEGFKFDFDKRYQIQAREKFSTLPKSDQRRLNLLQFSQATQKGIFGVVEFPQRVFRGALTSYKEVDGRAVKSQLPARDPRIVARIKSQPDMVTLSSITQPVSFVKEKARSPDLYGKVLVTAPFVLSGGFGVGKIAREVRKGKSVGSVIKQGVADASPFKIVEGTFTPRVSSVNLISRRKVVEGVTQRTFYGGKGAVDVRGFEVSKKGVSAGFIRTDRPFIDIKAGGTTVRSGTQTTIQPFVTSKVRTGKGLFGRGMTGVKGRGAVADVKLTDGITTLKDTTGKTTTILSRGTMRTRTGAFTRTGKAGEVFITGRVSGSPAQQLSYKQIVRSPTVKGIEISSRSADNVFKGFGKVKPVTTTKQVRTFTAPVSEVLGKTQSVSLTSQAPKNLLLPPSRPPRVRLISPLERTRVVQQSQFTGSGQYELTTPQQTRQILSPMTLSVPKQEVSPFVSQMSKQSSQLVSRSRTRTALDSLSRTKTDVTTAQRPMQRLSQRQLQRNVLKNLLRQPGRGFRPPTPRLRTPRLPGIPRIPGFKITSKGKKDDMEMMKPFQVLGRRFGKFRIVGVGRTKAEAFSIGTNWAKQSLGATFKVPGTKAKQLTGFTTKKTKEGTLYIEPIGQRLKRGTREIPEIQLYRRSK